MKHEVKAEEDRDEGAVITLLAENQLTAWTSSKTDKNHVRLRIEPSDRTLAEDGPTAP